ncbi:hypothetical protein GCM10027290_40710 [Micromonospora sonneratiae]|uniref:Uncharacterized protein n=1 Tax=Micromonospora sonneratiae TaxID=1184706 RepID=A0ABW3YL88_9ACTN
MQVTPPIPPPGPANPPSGLPGPATPTSNVERRGLSWGRLVLVAAMIGLVSLLGAGAGTFLLARNAELAEFTARCGTIRCIPISPSVLVDALKQKGFTCEEQYGDWRCQLRIAGTEFEAYFGAHENLINDLSASVRSDEEEKIPAATKSFLLWIGSLPFGGDPVTVEEVRGWLTQRFESGDKAMATIGSYNCELTAEQKRILRLRIWVRQG